MGGLSRRGMSGEHVHVWSVAVVWLCGGVVLVLSVDGICSIGNSI